MSIISKLLLLAVAAVGALAALKIIPTKAKKSLPAAIVFALTALLLVISLITSMINMGLFAPNTENDGHKRKDPCVITDGTYNRSYHPCLEDGNEVWFEYVSDPKSDGQKRFYLEGIDSDYTISIYKGKSKDAFATATNDELVANVESGETYIILVELNGYVDYSWKISVGKPIPKGASEDKAYELTEDGMSYTAFESLEDYAYVWFKFIPKSDGYYMFSTENSYYSSYYDFDVLDGYGYKVFDYNDYYSLTAGSAYYVYVYDVFEDGFSIDVETLGGTSFENAIEISADDRTYVSSVYGVHSDEMYFEFTPETSGWYSISTNYNYSYEMYLYSEDDTKSYLTSSYNTGVAYSLTANTTYYVQLTYYSTDDTFYMYVEPVLAGESKDAAYELTEGENEAQEYESLVDGTTVWFKFTPDTSGYYQIYLTGASADYSYYVYQGTSTSTQSASGVYYYMNSSYTYYVKYYVTDDDSFGVNVEKARGNSMSNGIVLETDVECSTGYNSSVHSSYEMYFEFTPETNGWYTFSLTDANTHYLYLYDDINGSYIKYTSSSTPLSYELEADTTYYLKVYFYSSYDTSYSIIAHANVDGEIRENAYELAEGENEAQEYASLVDGSSIWFKFVPTTSGYYQLVLTDASADHSYYVYQGTSTSTQSTYSVYYYLSSGYTYYINYYGVTGDDSFGVNIEAAKGTSLSNPIVLEESVERYTGYYSSVHSSYRMYFEFTPETSDSYVFSLRDADGNYLYLYDESGSYLTYTSGTSTLQYELEAGSTYYLMVDFSYSGSYDYYYYVTARPTAKGENRDKAYSLTEGLNEAEEYENLKYNDFVWFEFTPEEDGYYQFANTDASTYYYFYVYEGDSTSYKSSTAGNYYYLTSGYTYYVYYYSVTNDNSFGVMISTNKGSSMTDAIELTEGDLRYVGYNSSYNSGYEMYFEFTPDVTYEYNFYLSNVNSCSLYLYDSTDGDYITYSTYSTSLSYELTAGTTYYLRVYFNSSYDTSYSIKVSQVFRGTSADDAINLVLGASSISTGYDSSYNTNGEIWYKFTSSDADQYALYLSSIYEYHDIYVYDDAEATNRIAGGTSYYGSEYVYVNCEANTTYYVMIDFTSYVDTSFYIQAYQY